MSETPLLRLSVLDQSPVPDGTTPTQALANSVNLAQHVERLGYTRFWMSEHHAMDSLACTAPEIVLARIGAATEKIRIGSGGIMLPHYSALKVAEVFRTLHALYPGRVDLGIGRAPGGGQLESNALREPALRQQPMTDDFPQKLAELLQFLDSSWPASHPYSRIRVSPDSPGEPDVWLLGSSLWSASAAAAEGLPYAFAHFFSPIATRQAMQIYNRDFMPGTHRAKPEATAAVGVICAETDAEADRLHASVRLLQFRIRQGLRLPIASPEDALRELAHFGDVQVEDGEWPRYFVGTPDKVRKGLEAMAGTLGFGELIINTITHDHAARLRSYELLAEEFALKA